MEVVGTIYARYSTDHQREESIEGQLRICMEYAKREGIKLIDPYIDRALSAKTDNRPAFRQMIKDSHKKLFDVVIVYKLDRFARSMNDATTYKAILKKNGVQVMSATESISDRADGILMEAVLIGMAEYYSAELSEKVSRGHHENALKCKHNGGALPFGLRVDAEKNYQIEPVFGPIVLEMFQRYDNGETMQQIADYLVSIGIRSQRGNAPNCEFVRVVLQNKKYAGYYVYDDISKEDAIPAIVQKDLFWRVQKKIKKNKKVSAKYRAHELYLLSSKLFCGDCGAGMNGESGHGRNGVHYYYKCSNKKKRQGCKGRTVKKDHIENLVVYHTWQLLFDDARLNRLIKLVMQMQSRSNENIPCLKRQINDVEKSIDNIMKAIEQGIFTASTKTRLEDLEDRKAELGITLIKEEMKTVTLSEEEVQCWLHRYRKMNIKDPKQRQQLIDNFVNTVYLYDDHLILAVNFREGTTKVPFSLINGSDTSGFGPPKSLEYCRFQGIFHFVYLSSRKTHRMLFSFQ